MVHLFINRVHLFNIDPKSQKLKMEKIYSFLEQKHELSEYDDSLVRSLIKTIRVINEQKMEIHFKSGTVMTQRIIEKEY